MKAELRLFILVWVLAPCMAAADAGSPEAGRSAGYQLGYFLGRLVGAYGPYLCAASLAVVLGWLWWRRAQARRVSSGSA